MEGVTCARWTSVDAPKLFREDAQKMVGKVIPVLFAAALCIEMCSGFGLSSIPRLDRLWVERNGRISQATSLRMSRNTDIGKYDDDLGITRRAVWRTEDPGNLKDLKLVKDALPPP